MNKFNSPEADLDELLSEDVSAVKVREVTTFDQMTDPYSRTLVLFGSGNLGRKVLACLREDKIEPVAFADNDPVKWGKWIDGVQILSPTEAANRFRKKAAFVVTIYSPGHRYLDTRRQLLRLGCGIVVPAISLLWKYADVLLPHFSFDLPHKTLEQSANVSKAFELLKDRESQNQFVSQLKWRLQLDDSGLPEPTPQNAYFPTDIVNLAPDEVFVDCGAYDGDTIRGLLARQSAVKSIIAFEPDPLNFKKLSDFVSTFDTELGQRIELFNSAVGSVRGKVRFDASGTTAASVSNKGSMEVDCLPLDEVLETKTPTFLKLDIEGAEMDALVGAKSVLKRAIPKIAVCVYHLPDDLWQIPLFLSSLDIEYEYYLRSHYADGLETVLYAMPPSRLPSPEGLNGK